jgi:predicted PurR-regulated permease PerM
LLAIMHAVQSGVNIWMVLGLTGLVFVGVQIIQDVILVPKIMGKVTGLNPACFHLS